MPRRLYRCYGAGYLHFITTSCYQRQPFLATPRTRDLFLEVLERVRRQYRFVAVGYVVMPEHVHLLLSEPERGDLSMVMQVLKQSFPRRMPRLHQSPPIENREGWGSLSPDKPRTNKNHVWRVRFYDFPVFTQAKKIEKLGYMHRNPVKRGLVSAPDQWKWSSFRYFAYGEVGTVLVDEHLKAEMKIRTVAG